LAGLKLVNPFFAISQLNTLFIVYYIMLQLPNLKSKTKKEYVNNYEKLLSLLLTIKNNSMATTKELLEEIDSLEFTPEETKELFRKVVTTVDSLCIS